MKLTKVFVGYYILPILAGLYNTLSINLSLLQKRWVEIEKRRHILTVLLLDTKKRKGKKKRRQRRFWTRPGRTSSRWQSFRNNLVVEEEWRENFRLSKTMFNKLCNELRPFLQKKRTSMRAPFDVKSQVAITLYILFMR